jgi:hypothetical protein
MAIMGQNLVGQSGNEFRGDVLFNDGRPHSCLPQDLQRRSDVREALGRFQRRG